MAVKWGIAVGATLLTILMGCSGDGELDDVDAADGVPARSSLSPADFSVAWTGADGQELPDGVGEANPELVINTVRGPEHCGWESAVIMHLAWPVGTVTRTMPPGRQYVRDPGGVLPLPDASFQDSTALPDDAAPTGMRNGEIELWVAQSTAEAEVYVGLDGAFETWPRVVEPAACG